MLRNRVAGALFKSLLRWNRRPEVVGSKFALDGASLGIAKFLPQNATITNSEGLQAAVYHCFRTLDGSPENIDLGFKVLRDLNTVSQTLTERVAGRESRSKPEIQGIATFRVGQVVQHKKYNVRGVVTGWSLDETNTKQIVEVLPDVVDANELAHSPNLYSAVFVDSSLLQLVEDKDLHRIINRDLRTYFDGYDINRRRYMPNTDLKYWYQSDLAALDNDAITGKNYLPATELKALHKALFSVQNTTVSIGRELHSIVARHTEKLQHLSAEDQDVAQQILDEVNKCIQGCILEGPTTPVPLPGQSFEVGRDLAKQQASFVPFARKLVRGGVHRNTSPNSAENTSTTAEGSVVKKSGRKMSAEESERVYYAVGYLGNCFSAVDQLLQLRFQARGMAYHDGLRLQRDAHSGNTQLVEVHSNHLDVAQWNQETTLPAARFKVGQIIKHKKFGYRGVIAGYDQRPSTDMSKWEGILDLEFGQEQPIYKVIPDEGDVHHMLNKPEFRASYLVAQENLELVTERPDFLVRHPHLSTLFQGFDFPSGTYRVPAKLQYCFSEVLPSVGLSDSGVSGAAASTELIVSATLDANPDDSATAVTVKPAHRVVDELLVELLTYLRTSLSLTRTNDALYRAALAAPSELHETNEEDTNTQSPEQAQHALQAENEADTPSSSAPLALNMQDLLLLLRSAKCQDHALYVESLLWTVWVSHTMPEINKLVRLSIAHAKRGNVEQAIDVISRAVDFDPSFAEAYNKRASYRHIQQAYDECIEDAQLSLDIFPDHVGALSGLSLCFEQKDKPEQAIKAIRKALELHPWAAHLPTLLISMQTEFIKKAKRGSSASKSSTSSSSDVQSSGSNSAVRDV